MNAIVTGDQEQVDKIFNRIERYSKMITDPAFLKFGDLTDDLKYFDSAEDSEDLNMAITDENLSDIISLRHMNTFKSSVSKATVLKSMLTKREQQMESSFKPKNAAALGPGKSLTMLEPKIQNSEYLKKSQDVGANNG